MSSFKFSSIPKKVPAVSTKYRRIQTKIPAPGTNKLLRKLDKLESKSMHGQLPLAWDRAKNFNIWDSSGNCWIDFTSGIFFSNIGHSNPRLTRALKGAINKPLLGCYAYPNEIRAKYIEDLINFAGKPFEKCFLLSAGTESTEAAFKLMRMNGNKFKKRRLGIIAIENNWHGRTMGAQLLSSNKIQKEWIGFRDRDVHHIPFPYPWDVDENSSKEFLLRSLKELSSKNIDLKKDVCGFMLETFQGWGAVFYPEDYVKEIKKICDQNNILLAFDEMQSGFARTGRNFGYQHYGITPDLICCGKGMGGGVPLSGVLGRGEVMDLPEIGDMSSTHSANPLVCSAGIAVLEEIKEKKLTDQATKKGVILFSALNKIKDKFKSRISYVLGKGLIASLIFIKEDGSPDSESPSKVAELCMQKGLLVVHTGRESIKLGPPLSIYNKALVEGLDVLEESIDQILG